MIYIISYFPLLFSLTDGRAVGDVRPIEIETSLLPGAHGSCLFTRSVYICVYHVCSVVYLSAYIWPVLIVFVISSFMHICY